MTLVTLNLRRNTIADDVDNLVNRISKPGNRQTRSIADAIRREFAANFTRQGSGAGRWARLAPMTVAQRRMLGFAGRSPILVRTGRYRASFVQRGAPNHFEEIRTNAGFTTISVGSDDERGPDLERGVGRMPARPVTILDSGQEGNIYRVIDFAIQQIENNAGIR